MHASYENNLIGPNYKPIVLMFFPVLATIFFLFLPLHVFVLLTLTCLLVLLSLLKPEIGGYLIVGLVVLGGNLNGFFYHADLTWRDLPMENGLIVPLFSFFLLLECLVLAARKFSKIDPDIRIGNPLAVFLVFIILFTLFGMYWRGNVTSPVILIIFLSNIVLFFYVFTLCVADEKHLLKIIDTFIAAGCLASVAVIVTTIFHPEYSYIERITKKIDFVFIWTAGVSAYRGYSFELSNFASRTLNLASCLLIGRLFISSKKTTSFLLWCLLIFVFFANCLTASKGGLGSFLLTLGFFLVFSVKLRKNIVRNAIIVYTLFILVFIASIGFAYIFADTFRSTNIDISGKSLSVITRLEYWVNGFRAIHRESAQITGLGLGGYEYFSKSSIWPHNIYFSFYFDFGIVGVLFLTFILALVLKYFIDLKLWKDQTTDYQHISLALVGGLVAVIIHGSVEFYYNNSINWLFLAILFAGLRKAVDEQSPTTRVGEIN